MQFLEKYFSLESRNQVLITAQQGSDFAKQVAGDFNPIHDVGSKRFCVPGDLLFAIALHQYGLRQSMTFRFLDMVSADSSLLYPELLSLDGATIAYADGKANGKTALDIKASGDTLNEPSAVESMLRKYVAFSGQNFPHILLPLMEQHAVMINPLRPLVIYESMSFDLQTLNFIDLDIKLEETSLDVQGKRGNASLNFSFYASGDEVGRGVKKLVLSGLRPYEANAMNKLRDDYLANATEDPGSTLAGDC